MQTIRTLIAVVAVAVIAGSSFAKETKTDPSGTWRWEYDWEGETVKDSLELFVDKGGKIMGRFHGRSGEVEVKDISLEGDQLSLSFPMDFQGTEVVLDFTGKMKGDDIEGSVSADANGETYEFPWNPKRSVMVSDVLGTWNVRIETPDGNVLEPILKIAKSGSDLNATYTTIQGHEMDVKDITVRDNHLTFTVTGNFNGTSLQADYKARPYGNKMSGDIDYDFDGNIGELPFTAERKSE